MLKLFFLLVAVICMSSCQNQYENLLENNTSEIRQYLFEGKSENISASLIIGMREKNYIVNGYSGELIEFGVLSFDVSKCDKIDSGASNFILFVGTDKFEGGLQENPFDKTLVADIKKIIDCNKKVIARIISKDYEQDIELKCVNSKWKVNADDVYKIVAKKLKKEISAFVIKNNFEGEVYIKIINDADINVGDYYWFVNIVGRGGSRLSAIISPNNSEILAINNYT